MLRVAGHDCTLKACLAGARTGEVPAHWTGDDASADRDVGGARAGMQMVPVTWVPALSVS